MWFVWFVWFVGESLVVLMLTFGTRRFVTSAPDMILVETRRMMHKEGAEEGMKVAYGLEK